MSIDTRRTPQEYEVLSGGGAEAAELGKRGISRRQLLRRATALTLAVVGAEVVGDVDHALVVDDFHAVAAAGEDHALEQ